MTGDAVGHANQLVAVLEARGLEIWGAGWAWIETRPDPTGFDLGLHEVPVRFFAPTEDVCELLTNAAEASDDPVKIIRNGAPGRIDLDVRGTIECAIFERRELRGSLSFPVVLTDIASLRFIEPLLELQFVGQSCPELRALLSRCRS